MQWRGERCFLQVEDGQADERAEEEGAPAHTASGENVTSPWRSEYGRASHMAVAACSAGNARSTILLQRVAQRVQRAESACNISGGWVDREHGGRT